LKKTKEAVDKDSCFSVVRSVEQEEFKSNLTLPKTELALKNCTIKSNNPIKLIRFFISQSYIVFIE
jgi:hypothetical protein